MEKFLEDYKKGNETNLPWIWDYPEKIHDKIISWISLQPETCAKRNTYYAIFSIPWKFKFTYLERAIELDPEYLLAYFAWFYYWHDSILYYGSHEFCNDHHKTIKYGEKIINSGLYKDHYYRILPQLIYAYNEIGDMYNYLKYSVLNVNLEKKYLFIKFFGPDITIDMAKKVYLNVNLPEFSLIQRLLKENEELRLMPGGSEYQKAKEDFYSNMPS